MSMNFAMIKGIIIPKGRVNKIKDRSGKVLWKQLAVETSNFSLADGSILVTSDGQIFKTKEE